MSSNKAANRKHKFKWCLCPLLSVTPSLLGRTVYPLDQVRERDWHTEADSFRVLTPWKPFNASVRERQSRFILNGSPHDRVYLVGGDHTLSLIALGVRGIIVYYPVGCRS